VGSATIWAILSQTHLVTLDARQEGIPCELAISIEIVGVTLEEAG
jgi:hypothetical protein